MCGIAGIIHSRSESANAIESRVGTMVRAIAHRGPDGQGVWSDEHASLGHARLSIIDLSERACQPMHDASGRFVLVFNGELYNYRELRAELEDQGQRFVSASDSEVLLAAYVRWGMAALQRFNGMWAFAIWDRERRELFAARDRAGKKPLYYVDDGNGTFYFASEVKAFRALGMRFGLDPQAAFDFLTQGTYGHLGAQGFFAGVKQLPAAQALTMRLGEAPQLTRYWELPVIAERDRVPYDASFRARFRDLFTDAVSVRLRSDVPVGATLSGGLDSSAIVTVVDEITGGAPLHLFTSIYPGTGFDETPFFNAVVQRLRQPIVHASSPDDHVWVEQLTRVVDHQEEPFGDTSILAHFGLMSSARAAGVPVVLSGQGGDELLLGYPSMVTAYFGHLVASRQLATAVREISAWSRRSGRARGSVAQSTVYHALPLWLRDLSRRAALHRATQITTPALRDQIDRSRFAARGKRSSFDSYISQLFTRFAIPHLTHYDDRNAMAFGVEGRMPFLDHRVVELLYTASYDALYSAGFTKRVLRESFADLLPPIVRDRGDKIGFYTPMRRWLAENGAWVQRFMTRERIEALGVVDAVEFDRQWNALDHDGLPALMAVWRALVYHLWADRFDVAPLDTPALRGSTRRAPSPAARALLEVTT